MELDDPFQPTAAGSCSSFDPIGVHAIQIAASSFQAIRPAVAVRSGPKGVRQGQAE